MDVEGDCIASILGDVCKLDSCKALSHDFSKMKDEWVCIGDTIDQIIGVGQSVTGSGACRGGWGCRGGLLWCGSVTLSFSSGLFDH
jgi:hypothetical protein